MSTAYSNSVDSEQAAKALGCTRRHFTERLSKRPDFPKPVINLSQRMRRWRLQDLLRYAGQAGD